MNLKRFVRPLLPASARRTIRKWLLSELGAPLPSSPPTKPAGPPPDTFILQKRLVGVAPTSQVALDIFKGLRISKLPKDFAQWEAGSLPLFDDERIPEAAQYIGGIAGKTALDLGQLEGGQSYVLEKLGARSVVGVEANALLYLKCLVMKEVLGLQRTS